MTHLKPVGMAASLLAALAGMFALYHVSGIADSDTPISSPAAIVEATPKATPTSTPEPTAPAAYVPVKGMVLPNDAAEAKFGDEYMSVLGAEMSAFAHNALADKEYLSTAGNKTTEDVLAGLNLEAKALAGATEHPESVIITAPPVRAATAPEILNNPIKVQAGISPTKFKGQPALRVWFPVDVRVYYMDGGTEASIDMHLKYTLDLIPATVDADNAARWVVVSSTLEENKDN